MIIITIILLFNMVLSESNETGSDAYTVGAAVYYPNDEATPTHKDVLFASQVLHVQRNPAHSPFLCNTTSSSKMSQSVPLGDTWYLLDRREHQLCRLS